MKLKSLLGLSTAAAQPARGPAGPVKKTKRKSKRQERLAAFLKAHRGEWLDVRTLDGIDLKVLCGDGIGNDILRAGAFEPELSNLMAGLMRNGGHLLDLGANLGYFSCLAGRLGPDVQVAAVEPNPMLVGILKENFKRNGIRPALIVEAGVGPEAGTLELSYPRATPSLGTVGTLNPDALGGERMQTVRVPMVTFDDIVRQSGWSKIDLVKMDIEGMEIKVLASLSEEMAQRCDNFILEFYDRRLNQCGSRREDLQSVAWVKHFEIFGIGYLDAPVRFESLQDFPKACRTLWLRRSHQSSLQACPPAIP